MSTKTDESSNQSREWTLPVMDSANASTKSLGQGFDPSKTGAWTSFAIGAVTKHKLQDHQDSTETSDEA